jgi:glc operon protein GlcG
LANKGAYRADQNSDSRGSITARSVSPLLILLAVSALMTGGVPLIIGGHVVAAIGISAYTPDHDEQIAKAGAAGFAQ